MLEMRRTRQVSSIRYKLVGVAFRHLASRQYRPMGRQNVDTLVLQVICSFQLLLSNHSGKRKDSLQSCIFISYNKKLLLSLKHENLHEIFIFSLTPHLRKASIPQGMLTFCGHISVRRAFYFICSWRFGLQLTQNKSHELKQNHQILALLGFSQYPAPHPLKK